MKKLLIAAAAFASAALPTLTLAQDDNPSWWTMTEGRSVSLHYGVPDSEDVGLILQCDRPRAGAPAAKLKIYFLVEQRVRGGATNVQMRAGTVTGNVLATATPEEMYGGSELTAYVPVTSPVIVEFARTGRIRFTAAGELVNPAVAPVAKVAALLKVCRGS
ncbi:MAG: hypothetical protein U1E50_06400 [Caulobacteraceae bacterium]